MTPEPVYIRPTCWDLTEQTTGRSYAYFCRHTARLGCDLRVVGLTTYRLRGAVVLGVWVYHTTHRIKE